MVIWKFSEVSLILIEQIDWSILQMSSSCICPKTLFCATKLIKSKPCAPNYVVAMTIEVKNKRKKKIGIRPIIFFLKVFCDHCGWNP